MNQIASERKRLGMGQEKLAEKIGVTRETVSRWETIDERTVPASAILGMTELFSCSADYLLGITAERLPR